MRRIAALLAVFFLCSAVMADVSAGSGQRAWVGLSHGASRGADEALVVTTTSGGGRIIVAGLMERADFTSFVAVVAYRYDGTVAWRARYAPPPPFEPIYVEDIAIAGDDREVIVTATLIGPDNPMAVIGFDASSGALDWSWSSAPVNASARGLATAPGRVIVVGIAGRSDSDRFVVAFRPLTGEVVWKVRSEAPLGDASADSVVVRRGRAFVAGSVATKDGSALRSAAFATADGSVAWQDTFRGARAGSAVGFADNGSTVLIQAGWRIIRYDTQTGARDRVDRLDPAWKGVIRGVTLDPRGATVFVTGSDERVGSTHSDMVTAAYDLGSRRRSWFARFDGGGWGEGIDVVWVPSRRPEVVVTGGSEVDSVYGWRTVAYRSATGRQLWSDLYRGPLHEQGFPRAITSSPGGQRVYVVGYTTTSRLDDFATVAYRTT